MVGSPDRRGAAAVPPRRRPPRGALAAAQVTPERSAVAGGADFAVVVVAVARAGVFEGALSRRAARGLRRARPSDTGGTMERWSRAVDIGHISV
jgi:hypothetical protein